MNKLIITIAIFALAISITQAQSPVSQAKDSIAWKTLTVDNFEIDCPDNWVVDTSHQLGSSFFLFSQLTDKNDQFKENINLITQDLAGYNVTLDQYAEATENQVKNLITDGKIISSEKQKKGEEDFHKIIYTGKQGIYDLKFLQYFWLLDSKAYVLTLTCEIEAFENYLATGERILDSFKIIKQ